MPGTDTNIWPLPSPEPENPPVDCIRALVTVARFCVNDPQGATPGLASDPALMKEIVVVERWLASLETMSVEDRVIAHVGHVDPSDSQSPYRALGTNEVPF